MLKCSSQTYLHNPIFEYLDKQGSNINLSTGCHNIVHGLHKHDKLIHATGIWYLDHTKQYALSFDTIILIVALDVLGIKKVLLE